MKSGLREHTTLKARWGSVSPYLTGTKSIETGSKNRIFLYKLRLSGEDICGDQG